MGIGDSSHLTDEPTGRGMKKIAAVLAMCLASAGCGLISGADSLGEMSIERTSGSVSIQRGDETFDVVDVTSLAPGDVITTTGDARAELRLEGGRAVGLRGSGALRIGSGQSIESLEDGSLLARVNESTKITIGDVTVTSTQGVFRLDRGRASERVGTYEGMVKLEAPGQDSVAVEPLHQASFAAGELLRARPYHLSYGDAWDALLLSDVIRLDREMNSLGLAVSRQIGRGSLDLGYFRRLAGREVDFMRGYRSSSNSDLLIGFAIARSVDDSLAQTFKRAFRLFGDGAQWGVAAILLGARPGTVVASLEESILSTGALAAALGDDAGAAANGPLAASGGANGGGASSETTASTSNTSGSGSTDTTGTGGTGGTSGTGGTGGSGGSGGTGGTGSGGGGTGGGGTGGGDDGCDNLVDCSIEELPLPSLSPLVEDVGGLLP